MRNDFTAGSSKGSFKLPIHYLAARSIPICLATTISDTFLNRLMLVCGSQQDAAFDISMQLPLGQLTGGQSRSGSLPADIIARRERNAVKAHDLPKHRGHQMQ